MPHGFIAQYNATIRILPGLVVALVFLSACSNARSPAPESHITPPVAVEDYKIGVGDQLQVNVWQNPDLSVNVPVRPDGKISTPLVEAITAAGKTTEELASDITEVLDTFLKSPKVTVIVSNPGSTDFQRRVRITGAVNNPQSIAYRDGMTVLDLVLLAGGPNDFASLRKAKLYRKTAEGIKVFDINLDALLNKGASDQDYPLQPSDKITVPERRF